ncbi:MAG: DNA polymerase IV [Planctomycetota bacterium]
MDRRILHLDIDAFLASLEQLRAPALRGRPVAVGSGCVVSRSYEAKARGITTGMGMAEARRRCPELVVCEGDARLAERYRQKVAEVVRRFTPVVEICSLDDFYGDLTGVSHRVRDVIEDPIRVSTERSLEPLCRELREVVRAETGLSVAQGIGGSRTVARMATIRAKPGGICEVPPGAESEFLAEFPIEDVPGIGPKAAELLRRVGIARVRELWAVDRELLRRTFGARGEEIWWRCRGLDEAPVQETPVLRSISRETSFEPAEDDAAQQLVFLRGMLSYLVDRAASEMRRLRLRCRTVAVKLRHVDGVQNERRRSLCRPTERTAVLAAAAAEILDCLSTRRVLVRLLGVTLSSFAPRGLVQGTLFEGEEERGARLSAAVDAIRARHGFGSLLEGGSAALLGRVPLGRHGFRLRTPSLAK